jgi:hypothetical protein
MRDCDLGVLRVAKVVFNSGSGERIPTDRQPLDGIASASVRNTPVRPKGVLNEDRGNAAASMTTAAGSSATPKNRHVLLQFQTPACRPADT